MSQRKVFLDSIRGLVIIWMLIVHISLNYGYITYGEPFPRWSIFSWFSYFMVPFYFFSGYLFNPRCEFKEFLWRKEKTLLFPYFVYLLFGAIVYELYKIICFKSIDHTIFFSLLPSGMPFYNTPLWFLISLFTCNVVYYWISKLPSYISNIIITLCFLYAYYVEGRGYPQFLMHRAFFLGIVYFHLGHTFSSNYTKISNIFLFGAACVLFVGINVIDQQSLWFVENFQSQGNYILNLLFSLSAIYILYFLFSRFQRLNNRYVALVGRCSLVIFATHRPLLNYVYEPLMLYLFPNMGYGVFLGLGLIFLLLMAYIIYMIFQNVLPIVVGVR